jgi:O-antigen ligase
MTRTLSATLGQVPWRAYLLAALYFLFPIALGVSNLVLLVLLLLWLASWRHRETWSLMRRTPIVWWLAGLYLLVLLGLTYTSAPADWYSLHLSKYARLLYAVALIGLLWQNDKAQQLALRGFVAAMLITLVSTWLNVWFLLPWSVSQDLGWGVSHHVFGDYITQNVMMSFFAIVALHFGRTGTQPALRVLWILLAVLAMISITHLSKGRTGFVLVVVGLIAYVLATVRGRWLVLLLAGVVAVAGIAFASSNLLQARFTSAYQQALNYQADPLSAVGHRIHNYTTTAELIAQAPILGHGTGAYHVRVCDVMPDPATCNNYTWHPHNQFLFLGADHGVIGMLLYGGIFACMYLVARRSRSRLGRPLLLVLTTLMLLDSLVNSPLWSSRESQFFMYMLALFICIASNRGAPPRAEPQAADGAQTRSD